MNNTEARRNKYDASNIQCMEWVYGEGFMSPGGAQERIESWWPKSGNPDGPYTVGEQVVVGEAAITSVPGYDAINLALTQLIADQEAGRTDVLSDKPFPAGAVIEALLDTLAGLESLPAPIQYDSMNTPHI